MEGEDHVSCITIGKRVAMKTRGGKTVHILTCMISGK